MHRHASRLVYHDPTVATGQQGQLHLRLRQDPLGIKRLHLDFVAGHHHAALVVADAAVDAHQPGRNQAHGFVAGGGEDLLDGEV